jgi:peptidoglycan/LPS O-acetylase OafA/YrhL
VSLNQKFEVLKITFLNSFTDFFKRFLEWKGFAVTTKFSYAFYLIQIPIFQLSIANTKDVRFHTPSSMINLNEIFVICAASIFLTLFIEAPFNNIKKLLFSPESNSNQNLKLKATNESKEKKIE